METLQLLNTHTIEFQLVYKYLITEFQYLNVKALQ